MISNYGRKSALIFFLLVLIALSATVVSLKYATVTFSKTHVGECFYYMNVDVNQKINICTIPTHMYSAATNFLIDTGVISIVLSTLTLIYATSHIQNAITSLRPSTALAVFIALSINAFLALAAMITLNYTHDFSDHMNAVYNATLSDGGYQSGTFDLETWVCEAKTLAGISAIGSTFEDQCRVEIAGRLVVIPWVLAAVMVAWMTGWVVWDVKMGMDGKDDAKEMGWREWVPLKSWGNWRRTKMPESVPLARRPYSSQYSAAYRSAA